MLLGAVCAFSPIFAVDFLVDNYVKAKQEAAAEQVVGAITGQIEARVAEAAGALKRVLADSPSLCTPTFIANVQHEVLSNLSVRQFLVEDRNGTQYCDAYGQAVAYSPLSHTLPLPASIEAITVVRLADMDMPVLKITRALEQGRRISVFMPMLGFNRDALARSFGDRGGLRIVVTNGLPILEIGNPDVFDRQRPASDFIRARGFAGELPLRVEVSMPFDIARAGYADLDMALTVLSCLMSAMLLLLLLQYARRSRVPAFDLERAVAGGEIKPYYQPVIDLQTGYLVGCEMLARWERRNGQLVPPDQFIDLAEASGLAIPMTLSLMQQVKTDLGDLCRRRPELKVAINLFEGHFRDGSIVEDVQAIFGGSQIGFHQLAFEITERQPLANFAQANTVIAGLHALGARVAMDDAGTGHSNLAYLQTLGVDIIKLDRVFIDMIKPETKQVPVLDALIAMAHDLGCEIVAEGVETEAQALYLKTRGVRHAQGYLFAPALKLAAFKDLADAMPMGSGEVTILTREMIADEKV